MQFGGARQVAGKDDGFCMTITHPSLVVLQFLAEKSIPVISQSPDSRDLFSNEFYLFPIPKIGLKETCFATMEDIESNATAELFPTMAESMDEVCMCASTHLNLSYN
jgi:hypothetical protein